MEYLLAVTDTVSSPLFGMASDIVTRELKQPIDVAEYLYRRLYEVGIRSVHGVPGTFSDRICHVHDMYSDLGCTFVQAITTWYAWIT